MFRTPKEFSPGEDSLTRLNEEHAPGRDDGVFTFRWIFETIAISLLYVLTAWFGFRLSIHPGNITPVWLPSGIAFCAVICRGYRAGVGVWFGSYVANALFFRVAQIGGISFPSVTAMIIATGSVLQAFVGVYLIRRLIGPGSPIGRPLSVLKYVSIGAISCCIASTVGVTTLRTCGLIPGGAFANAWWTWWAGDLGGVVVFAPLLMSFRPSWNIPTSMVRGRLAEGVFLLFLEIFLLIRIFVIPESKLPFERLYPLVLVVIWAAYRFGQRGVTVSVVLIAAASVWGTAMNRGPLADDDINASLVSLDLFLGLTSLSGLLLSAALAGMADAMDALRTARDDLGRRVEEKTSDLKRINRILNEAQQQAHIGSWEWDVVRDRVTWTEELHRIYGRVPGADKLTFDSFLMSVHPDDRGRIQKIVEHSCVTGEPSAYDYRVLRPDGTIRIVHAEGKTVRDETGQIVRMFGNAQDITGRVEMEQKYQRLLESAPESIVVTDESGSITVANSQTENIFGYTREELIGRNIEDLIPERLEYQHLVEPSEYIADPHARPMGGNRDLYGRRKDGTEFPVEVALSPLMTSEGTLITTAIRDLTDRREAEATILKLNRELEERVMERTSQLQATNTELEKEIESHLETERRLTDSSDRYRNLFENSPISLWEEDFSAVREYLDRLRGLNVVNFREYFASHREEVQHCEGLVRVRAVNKRTLELYRAGGKEELLARLSTVLSERSHEVFLEGLVAIAEGRNSFAAEDVNTTLTGVPINILLRWNVTSRDDRSYSRVLVSVVDITEQKRIEEEIRLLAHAVESTSEMISITDLSDRFIFVNKAFIREYGYEEAEILGQTPRLLLAPGNPSDIDDAIFAQTRLGGWNGELTNRRKDGSEFPISLSTSQIRDSAGRVLGLIGVATNITERRRAEQALVEAELRFHKVFDDVAQRAPDLRQEVQGVTSDQTVTMDDLAQKIDLVAQRMRTSMVRTLSFASLASHELRTPLAVVRHQLEEGLDLHTPESSLRKIIVSVYDEVLRLNRIVETLLSLSSLQAGTIRLNRHRISLQHLLKEFYEDATLLSRERNISVVLKHGPPVDILGDAERLRQVLYNLLDNSLKYTSPGGRIWLEYELEGQEVVLKFSDDGKGVDPEDVPRMFDPFFRGAARGEDLRGAGLGLSLAKWIVETHGGRISARSESGCGTCIIIRLGVAPPE